MTDKYNEYSAVQKLQKIHNAYIEEIKDILKNSNLSPEVQTRIVLVSAASPAASIFLLFIKDMPISRFKEAIERIFDNSAEMARVEEEEELVRLHRDYYRWKPKGKNRNL